MNTHPFPPSMPLSSKEAEHNTQLAPGGFRAMALKNYPNIDSGIVGGLKNETDNPVHNGNSRAPSPPMKNAPAASRPVSDRSALIEPSGASYTSHPTTAIHLSITGILAGVGTMESQAIRSSNLGSQQQSALNNQQEDTRTQQRTTAVDHSPTVIPEATMAAHVNTLLAKAAKASEMLPKQGTWAATSAPSQPNVTRTNVLASTRANTGAVQPSLPTGAIVHPRGVATGNALATVPTQEFKNPLPEFFARFDRHWHEERLSLIANVLSTEEQAILLCECSTMSMGGHIPLIRNAIQRKCEPIVQDPAIDLKPNLQSVLDHLAYAQKSRTVNSLAILMETTSLLSKCSNLIVNVNLNETLYMINQDYHLGPGQHTWPKEGEIIHASVISLTALSQLWDEVLEYTKALYSVGHLQAEDYTAMSVTLSELQERWEADGMIAIVENDDKETDLDRVLRILRRRVKDAKALKQQRLNQQQRQQQQQQQGMSRREISPEQVRMRSAQPVASDTVVRSAADNASASAPRLYDFQPDPARQALSNQAFPQGGLSRNQRPQQQQPASTGQRKSGVDYHFVPRNVLEAPALPAPPQGSIFPSSSPASSTTATSKAAPASSNEPQPQMYPLEMTVTSAPTPQVPDLPSLGFFKDKLIDQGAHLYYEDLPTVLQPWRGNIDQIGNGPARTKGRPKDSTAVKAAPTAAAKEKKRSKGDNGLAQTRGLKDPTPTATPPPPISGCQTGSFISAEKSRSASLPTPPVECIPSSAGSVVDSAVVVVDVSEGLHVTGEETLRAESCVKTEDMGEMRCTTAGILGQVPEELSAGSDLSLQDREEGKTLLEEKFQQAVAELEADSGWRAPALEDLQDEVGSDLGSRFFDKAVPVCLSSLGVEELRRADQIGTGVQESDKKQVEEEEEVDQFEGESCDEQETLHSEMVQEEQQKIDLSTSVPPMSTSASTTSLAVKSARPIQITRNALRQRGTKPSSSPLLTGSTTVDTIKKSTMGSGLGEKSREDRYKRKLRSDTPVSGESGGSLQASGDSLKKRRRAI